MTRSPREWELGHRLWLADSFAAEMALFFALSLVPFVALTATLAVTWLPSQLGEPLADTLVHLFPSQAGLDAEAIGRWASSVHASGWLAAGVMVASWSTLRFMVACVAALGYLTTGQLPGWRKGIVIAVKTLPLVVMWMLAALAGSFAILADPVIREKLAQGSDGVAVQVIGALLARAPALIMLLLALVLTYRVAPGVGNSWPRLLAAAVLALGGWYAVGFVFSTIVPAVWRERDLYGALASFLLFMLWCYGNAWVLLLCSLVAGRSEPPEEAASRANPGGERRWLSWFGWVARFRRGGSLRGLFRRPVSRA